MSDCICLNMQKICVSLNISPERYLAFYRGTAKIIIATAEDGRRVQFPVNVVRKFVTREGIRGRFVIVFDDQNKFKSIERAP